MELKDINNITKFHFLHFFISNIKDGVQLQQYHCDCEKNSFKLNNHLKYVSHYMKNTNTIVKDSYFMSIISYINEKENNQCAIIQ